METGLLHLHNILRWVILILLIAAIFRSYSGWKGNKPFTPGAGKLWLFTMIAAHTTLLLGLYQWLFGRLGLLTYSLDPGTSIMKNKFFRFFWVEHPTAMILAIVLITLARGMVKKPVADAVKYRKSFWYFLVALLLILAAVPWPFRGTEIARPIFPGM